MNTYQDRDEGFSQLLAQVIDPKEERKVPCVVDKIKVMLTGRWEGHNVLARGNSIMPGKDLSKKIEKLIGEEVGSVCVHVCVCVCLHAYVVMSCTDTSHVWHVSKCLAKCTLPVCSVQHSGMLFVCSPACVDCVLHVFFTLSASVTL